ncbi:MAG: cyclic-di-AMP receptor [Anaerolineales bacterium]|nr:cyclic-di-AMP receptor [Anaerolineales bacterium]
MASNKSVDRVAIIILQGGTADELTRRLTQAGFQVTIIESRGGFILEPSSTLLIGFSGADQNILLEHVRSLCATHKRLVPVQPDGSLLPTLPLMIEAEVGGAFLVAFPVERFIQL